MNYLGDYAEDATIYIFFTTHDKEGGTIAPSSAFETDDFHVYKNGNAAEKATQNGMTISSPFVGLHILAIDTSNDTGDVGFWSLGGEYSIVLDPDETVDGESVVKVVGSFSIERTGGALAKAKVIDGIVDDILIDTGTTLDTKINTIDGIVDAILLDTAEIGVAGAGLTNINLPDQIMNIVGDITGNLSGSVGSVTSGVTLDAAAVDAILDDPVEGAITLRQAMRVLLAYLAGRASGGGTANPKFRDQANTKDRISMTVDGSGNRSSVTLDLT